MTTLEELLYSTVRITITKSDGSVMNGTAFFYNLKERSDTPVLICNNHLINNAQSGTIYFHIADEYNNVTKEEYPVSINNISNICYTHSDAANDISIINLTGLFLFLNNENVRIFYTCITNDMIPTDKELDEISVGYDIFLVGYPNDLFDGYNKLPIMRKGITSTPINKEYNGTNTFLIDAAIFPGSSGSPVVCFHKDKMLFLGIQKAMHLNSFGSANEFMRIEIRTPNNLGLVTKSNVLNAIPS